MEINNKKKFVLAKKTLILKLNKSILDFFGKYILYLRKYQYYFF